MKTDTFITHRLNPVSILTARILISPSRVFHSINKHEDFGIKTLIDHNIIPIKITYNNYMCNFSFYYSVYINCLPIDYICENYCTDLVVKFISLE